MIKAFSNRIIPESCYSTEKTFITYSNFTNKGIIISGCDIENKNVPFVTKNLSYVLYFEKVTSPIGITLPETLFTSPDDSSGEAFPYIIPTWEAS